MYGGWFSYEKDMQTAKKSDAGKAIYSMSFEKLKMVNIYLRHPLLVCLSIRRFGGVQFNDLLTKLSSSLLSIRPSYLHPLRLISILNK